MRTEEHSLTLAKYRTVAMSLPERFSGVVG